MVAATAVPEAVTWAAINDAASDAGLLVMGALHQDGHTLVLLGAGGGFWPRFSCSPEARDGRADPVDRWSTRVVGALATRFDAAAIYPFGGPPHAPFIDWAQKSGRAFHSPVGMLVHDTVGLMISYRGALEFTGEMAFPVVKGENPCNACAGQPCTTACPVGALGAAQAYDVAACHRHLDTPAGGDCMRLGCAARRACPLSRGAGRVPEQSALHMRAFHRP